MLERTAVIAGAGGLVGGHSLRRLLGAPGYDRVLALLRRPLPVADPKLEQHLVEFDQLAGISLPAVDAYCALGTTIRKAGSQAAFRRVDHDYVVAFARRTLECGARRFMLVSSIGADPSSSNFYLRVKAETERDVAALPFEAVHIFRPSILMGERSESRPAEGIAIVLARALSWAIVGPLAPYHPIRAEQVAAAMSAAARTDLRGVHIHTYADMIRLDRYQIPGTIR